MCCLFWIYFYRGGIELVQSTGLTRFICRNVAGFFFFWHINVNIHYKSWCFIVYCWAEIGSEKIMRIRFNFVRQHCVMRVSFWLQRSHFALAFCWLFFSLFYLWNLHLGCPHVLILFRMRFCWFGTAAIRIFFSIHCISICGFYLCYGLFVVFNSFVITVLRVSYL